MKLRTLTLAAGLAATLGTAQAAVTSIPADPTNDATGTIYGSTDVLGSLTGLGSLNLNLNGTTGNIFLEPLNPNLSWSGITLTVRDLTLESVFQSPSPTATFGGLVGSLLSSTKIAGPTLGVTTNDYTFSFAGALAGNTNYTLTLGGFSSTVNLPFVGTVTTNDTGFAQLSVTAVPEPESYALMLGGLGIVGFVARRRKRA